MECAARASPSAADALLDAGVYEALMHRMEDKRSSSTLRRRLIATLTCLVHHPKGMALFVQPPKSADAAADAPSTPADSVYSRLLATLAAPLPLPVLQPLNDLFSLVALWERANQLHDAAHVLGCAAHVGVRACDAACAPVLVALRGFTDAFLQLCAQVMDATE